MKTIEVNIYEFSELSDKAKSNAKYNHDIHYGYDGSDNEDTCTVFEKHFPVHVKTFEYGGCHPYVKWEFTESEEIASLKGFRLATYLWNNYKTSLYHGKYYGKTRRDSQGKFVHKKRYSKIILDNYCVLTGYYMDDEMMEPIYKFMGTPDPNTTFADLMDECMQAWIWACSRAWDEENSEEYFADLCDANGYMFYEDGRIVS